MSLLTNDDALNKLLDVSALAASGFPVYGASEVTILRKAGKIDEAYQKAKESIASDPDSLWAKRDLGWVLYSYLKSNISLEKSDVFLDYLKELDELRLPEGEKMLFDQLAWQIGKKIVGLSRAQNPDTNKIMSVFNLAKNFQYTKPSEGYSFLFKAFHKVLKDTDRYVAFVDWWNFNHFRPEDFQKEKLPNGKEVMSTAEQAIIAFSKHLLPHTSVNGELIFDKKKALDFLPYLDQIIEDHPTFQYTAYFKAKLLLALGDQENMLSALLPFVKKKRNDFWAWDVLSEAFPDDEQKKLACYCRALTCNTSDDFLINIRQKMAHWFIDHNMYDEAKTEIGRIVKARDANGWKLPLDVQNWVAKSWYAEAKENKTNIEFYNLHIPLAESLLYSDVPEEVIIIDFVNQDRKIANFIASESKRGFFKFDRFRVGFQIGDTANVRFNGNGNEGAYKVFTIEKVEDLPFKAKWTKDIEGAVRFNEGQSYGFVGDACIHPSIVKKFKLSTGSQLKGKAIKSYNSEKKRWGWKVFQVFA